MGTPLFLEIEDVVDLHRDLIERFGGSDGIRDVGLLASALAMPRAGVGDAYLHADVFEMAAAYLFHLVKNHPFLDGNKRIGASAALVFLEINGFEVDGPNDALADLVLRVATSDVAKSGVAEFLRKHAKPA